MPKQIRLIINMVFSLGLFFLLLAKAAKTIPNIEELAELWELDEPIKDVTSVTAWFFVFGVYAAIALTAAAVWTRGVPPIVLSAIGTVGSFALYCFELLLAGLYELFEVDKYIGGDPLVSAMVFVIACFTLAISIAELVIAKKKKSY
ncbi:MAG: hypothetical protein NC299_03510 [Lachnospiraceae bacterium]|nr:hypothetical protein [Ruminococcus sp.]MCM1274417.1 hypothetical protein [Lachnospiraceae bacterium]